MAVTERAPQGVVILGSTGSIGTSTLDVINALPDRLRVVGLAAGNNVDLLQQQIDRYLPVAASTTSTGVRLMGTRQVAGAQALLELATLPEADIVVVATTSHAAIEPTIAALEAGKIVALANKEAIVAAGEIVMPVARSRPGMLRPVDSEHSALWQCLHGDRAGLEVARLVLTASGGPFRGWNAAHLAIVTPAMALAHPNWSMGAKVTIDSATLMNKGLELIEASWLFDCPLGRIDIVVHPQSLVHSCVEFIDGSTIAQIAGHDMRLPIQYALTWPDRLLGPAQRVSILEVGRLDFEAPDLDAFPMLRIAREAGERGGTWPTVLSAADSVAVDAFLAGQIGFTDIARVVDRTLSAHDAPVGQLTLTAILEADAWATEFARSCNADG